MSYPPEGFEKPGPHSRKIRCSICTTSPTNSGYLDGRWMDAHRRGHAPCTRGCGVVMSVLRNGKPRTHSKCPRLAVAA